MSLEEVVERRWRELRALPNVINVGVSTKVVGGVDTGRSCIVFYVKRKVEPRMLSAGESVPLTVEGACTDVVEVDADYTVGDTSVSRKPLSIQRRIAGGVRR